MRSYLSLIRVVAAVWQSLEPRHMEWGRWSARSRWAVSRSQTAHRNGRGRYPRTTCVVDPEAPVTMGCRALH